MPDRLRVIGTGGTVETDLTTADGTMPLNLNIPTGNVVLGRVEHIQVTHGSMVYEYPVTPAVTLAQSDTINVTFTFAGFGSIPSQRREAREKAEELLRSFLNREQRRALNKERAFWVKGPVSRQRYRIDVDDMACWLEHPDSIYLQHLCIVPAVGREGSDYPAGDIALAKLLTILTDERRFRETALPVVPLPDEC